MHSINVGQASPGDRSGWHVPVGTGSVRVCVMPDARLLSGSARKGMGMRIMKCGSTCALVLILAALLVPFSTAPVAADPLVTLSGRVLDPLGNGIPGQNVILRVNGDIFRTIGTTTDASGSYVLHAAPGSYGLNVNHVDFANDPSVNAPQLYSISTNAIFSLSADTTLD